MPITLLINDDIYRHVRADAARLGVTLTQYIEEALEARLGRAVTSNADGQSEIAQRDELMESLLQATAHFRVGPKPTRDEMHDR